MQIIEVQFTPWDNSYFFQPKNQEGRSLSLKIGDEVIVETVIGVDLGKVINLGELKRPAETGEEIKPIVRIATDVDKLKNLEINKDKKELLKVCSQGIAKYQLPMKLVDAHLSFDEKRLTYAFIADGRVDFRELVKDLIRYSHKSVRLQQIGVRDEAKICGDFSACGRGLCCKSFLHELGNVSTDFAKCQQIASRGSDRLSGVCGRLKCCLRFEQPMYEELAKGFPEIGSRFKSKAGEGTVMAWYPLKGAIGLNIGTAEERNVIEVKLKEV
ncbi:MAG: regulatory iron-sulfur-containing complex subunit RicT [Candidatus Komeilibacteria bacterium]|nr:regulatory iron-sulfur-containing complex subunit RicT [Candidatus Komeilibacteria bacterium]